jgi:hypothetical protein
MSDIAWMKEHARTMTSKQLMAHFGVNRPALYYQTQKHKIDYIREQGNHKK